MIVIITGASHTGKTALAQQLLEKYHYPYLSIDHLKMGLIRSGETRLTPSDDKELTPYLWKILKEIIKTAIENNQNLVVEGLYVPFDWKQSFSEEYLTHIRFYCLIMSERYIKTRFSDIRKYANTIETRLDDSDLTMESVLEENSKNLGLCQKYHCRYLLIDDNYEIKLDLSREEEEWN